MSEPLIFEKSSPGRMAITLPECDVPIENNLLPEDVIRKESAELPEVSQVDLVRHFIALSILNHHVDKGFYPLGSCTMKYNPKINDKVAGFSGLSQIHPLQPQSTCQSALQLMYELERYLAEISGLDEVTLQPVAGAHGELTGLMIIKAYHTKKGNPRSIILIPDSAHGTNPASTTLAGYQTMQIKSNSNGLVDIDALQKSMNDKVAGLMLTNPNTLGIFESNVLKISEIVHKAGGLVYMDGANLNALLGIARPGDMEVDILHFNLHKTFSTPHGGGGPGSGPVGVKKHLAEFLPVPRIRKSESNKYSFDYNLPNSIGKMHSFYGNFAIMVRAYAYIRSLGSKGLKEVTEHAIINANYIKEKLKDYYDLPYKGLCKHECVFSGDRQKAKGVKTLDIAKRLLDFGFHAPTIYFPLIVSEAIMIEPTETESKETLDSFIETMIKIAKEAEENPDIVKDAPHNTPVARLDEAKAAKEQILKF